MIINIFLLLLYYALHGSIISLIMLYIGNAFLAIISRWCEKLHMLWTAGAAELLLFFFFFGICTVHKQSQLVVELFLQWKLLLRN